MNSAEKPLPLAAWPWIISREKQKGACDGKTMDDREDGHG